MLIIKKKCSLFWLFLLQTLIISSFNTVATERNLPIKEQLIDKIELLFLEDPETLNYQEVIILSNKIITHRSKYPSEILAKAYLLLANVASNKGELETAYQFTKDGLAIITGDDEVTLSLQLKLASIFSNKREYKQSLDVIQKALKNSNIKQNIKNYLLALSYRSVAFAVLNQFEDALVDLQQVEQLIAENPTFAEHITLLTILANAHFHLGNFQTALTMQLDILKLRFNLNKLHNINQTYFWLANSYYQLNRFHDAYNAYWEAKTYAEKKSAPIYVAFATQGLGLTLIQQQQYDNAQQTLLKAKALFYQYNLAAPYLETIISLLVINTLKDQNETSSKLLIEADKLSTNVEITQEYIILYQLLADMYKNKGNLDKAYRLQKKYINALLKKNKANLIHQPSPKKFQSNTTQSTNTFASKQTRQLAEKLAEQSDLAISFAKKEEQQKSIIFLLAIVALLLLALVIYFWLKHKTAKLKNAHETIEKPSDSIAMPVQTKQLYQKNFNMARKHNYPLTLSYISISNWQELSFQFNKKIVDEVSKEIASVINTHINEFEEAGLINEGEYLLIFPHQKKEEVTNVIDKLVSALKLRFFANLGDFSVTITYSIESPNFQDIDPYIFLSQLSDSIQIA